MMSLWAIPARAGVIAIANACDVTIVPPGQGAGVAGAIEAAPGDTVLLTGDSVCNPTFDATGALLTGDGLAVAADDVIVDMNGHSITSAFDVAGAGRAQGLDVENVGLSVGARNVLVINSRSTRAVISEFTANIDLAKAEDSTLRGSLVDHDGDPATPAVSNILAGNAHGGGALAIDKSKALTIDTVELNDRTGDAGADIKRSEKIIVTNSTITGILTGVRIRSVTGYTLTNNTTTGGCQPLLIRDSSGTQNGNVLLTGVCPM